MLVRNNSTSFELLAGGQPNLITRSFATPQTIYSLQALVSTIGQNFFMDVSYDNVTWSTISLGYFSGSQTINWTPTTPAVIYKARFYTSGTGYNSQLFSWNLWGQPSIQVTTPANSSSSLPSFTAGINPLIPAGLTITYYVDNVPAGSTSISPYNATFSVASGIHTIYATATNSTTVVTSSTNTFTAIDNPPTIAITSPTNNGTLYNNISQSVNLTATTATAGNTVALYANGSLVGSTSGINGATAISWTPTTGIYQLVATATDTYGTNASTTNTINVLANSAPTIALSPNNGSIVAPGSVTFSATSLDTEGEAITGMQLFLNGAQVATSTTSSIAFTTNLTTGNYTLFATASDANTTATSVTNNISVNVGAQTVLLLHMDGANGGTSFQDSSAFGHTVTANGLATTETAVVEAGTASYAGNTNGYLTIPSATELNVATGDYTVEMWVYPTNYPTGRNETLLTKPDSSSYTPYRIDIDSTAHNYVFYGTTNSGAWTLSSYTTIGPVVLNQWQHLAISRIGTNIAIFENGILMTNVATPLSGFTNSGALNIGGWVWGGNTLNFLGYLDEVRITKGAGLYTGNFTPQKTAFTTTHAPVLALLSPITSTNVIAGANFTLSATAYDVDANGAVTQVSFLDGTNIIAIGTANQTNYTATWAPTAGTHTITAQATDNNGNTSQSSPITVNASYAQTVLLEHLDSNFSDSSGIYPAHTGPYLNGGTYAPTISTTTKIVGNGSAQFAAGTVGSGGEIEYLTDTNFDLGTGDLTIEAWVNINTPSIVAGDGANKLATFFEYGDGFITGGNTPWELTYSATAGQIWVTTQKGSTVTTTGRIAWAPTANTWYHLALTRQNGLATIWVNGASLGTFSWPDNLNYVATGLGYPGLRLGHRVGGAASNVHWYWPGYMDEARITKGVALYTSPFTPSTNAFSSTTHAPVLTLVSPSSNRAVVTGTTINLAAIANDVDTGGSVSQITFLDGTSVLATETGNTNQYAYNWIPTAGSHSITVEATDSHGNVSQSAAVAVNVDKPGLTINNYATTNQLWYVGLASPISYSATGIVSSTVTLTIDGALQAGSETAINGSTTYNWTPSTTGNHTVTLTATDSYGLVASNSISIPVGTSLTNSLLAWYKMNTSPGVTVDSSGNGRNLTLSAGISTSSANVDGGQSLYTAGSSTTAAYNANALPTITELTLSVWAYTTVSNINQARLAGCSSSTSSNYFYLNANYEGTPGVEITDNAGRSDNLSSTSPTTNFEGAWHLYTYTASASQGVANFYIDGTLQATRTISTSAAFAFANITLFNQGSIGGNFYFNGNLDDVRYYSRALSATDVKSLYASTIDPGSAYPTVSINASTTIFSSLTPITLTASPADPNLGGSISGVAFYTNGIYMSSVLSAPWQVNWTPSALTNYTITAVATNALKLTTVSSPINICSPNTALTVVITSPTNGAYVEDNSSVPITVSATPNASNTSITNVRIYCAGYLLGSFTNAPYTTTWQAYAGNQTITAIAYNNSGISSTNSVTITSDIQNGLTDEWKFDSNYLDQTGSHNLSVAAGTPTFVTGIISNAVSLNGASYLSNPNSVYFGNNNFTISTWVKSTDAAAIQSRIIGCNANSGSYWWLNWDGGRPSMEIGDITGKNNASFSSTLATPINDNQWHQVSVVVNRTSNQERMYVDGYCIFTNTATIAAAVGTAAGSALVVGSHYGLSGYYYTGAIDDTRIYQATALSDAQILRLYQETIPTNDTPPALTLTQYNGLPMSTNYGLDGLAISAFSSSLRHTITAVNYYLDSTLLGAGNTTNVPGQYEYNLTSLTAGSHTITAIATDTVGQTTTVTLPISVANNYEAGNSIMANLQNGPYWSYWTCTAANTNPHLNKTAQNWVFESTWSTLGSWVYAPTQASPFPNEFASISQYVAPEPGIGVDALIAFKAPATGRINITGNGNLNVSSVTATTLQAAAADGIRLRLWQNSQMLQDWVTIPTNGAYNINISTAVNSNDLIYAEVNAGTTSNANYDWFDIAPVITYTGGGPANIPQVTLTAPVNNINVATGASVALTANPTAYGSATVSSIDFLINGALLSTATSSPYTTSWTATTGTNTVTAIVHDSAGNTNASSTISIIATASQPGVAFLGQESTVGELNWRNPAVPKTYDISNNIYGNAGYALFGTDTDPSSTVGATTAITPAQALTFTVGQVKSIVSQPSFGTLGIGSVNDMGTSWGYADIEDPTSGTFAVRQQGEVVSFNAYAANTWLEMAYVTVTQTQTAPVYIGVLVNGGSYDRPTAIAVSNATYTATVVMNGTNDQGLYIFQLNNVTAGQHISIRAQTHTRPDGYVVASLVGITFDVGASTVVGHALVHPLQSLVANGSSTTTVNSNNNGVNNPAGNPNGIQTVTPTPVTYNGIFYPTTGIAWNTAGAVSITVSNLAYTGNVLTKGQDYAITGLLDTNGAGNISINRTNDTLLGISFAVTATNLLGAVGDGNWVADLTGEPAQIGTNSPVTYLLSTETQTIGVLTTSNYLSTITAALPDGSPWSQTCGISATGQWPIYQVTAQGALIGWFQQTPTNVVGTAILAPADTSNTNQLLQITGQPQ